MATDVERLIAVLEARTVQFDRALARATGTANRAAGQIENRFRSMNRNLDGVFSRFGGAALTRGFGLLAATLGVREVVQYADTWTRTGNQIAAAGVEAALLADKQKQLADIAVATNTGLEPTVELYSRLRLATKELGTSETDLIKVIETVNRVLAISGTSTAEAAGALRQLSQGLSSGTLRGEELNSILENAPAIARAISAEFGVSIGQLRKLGEEGKLTADRIINAILRIEPETKATFDKMQVTVGQAFTNLQTRFTQLVGELSKATGATAGIASIFNSIAESMRGMSEEVTNFRISNITLTIAELRAEMLRLQAAMSQDLLSGAVDTRALINAQQRIADIRKEIASLEQSLAGVAGAADDQAKSLKDALNTYTVSEERVAALRQKLGELGQQMSPSTAQSTDVLTDQVKDLTAEIKSLDEALVSLKRFAGDPIVDVEVTRVKKRLKQARKELVDATDQARGITPSGRVQLAFESFPPEGTPPAGPPAVVTTTKKTKKTPAQEFAEDIEQLRQRTETIQKETETLALNTVEREKALKILELEQQAKEAGLTISDELRQKIEQEAEAYARATDALEKAQKAQQQAEELKQFAGQQLTSFFGDLITGATTAEEALKRLIDALIQAAIQAAFLGQGPFGGLVGGGGLFSNLFGGARAGGGPVSGGRGYLVGEKGPELFMPGRSGLIIPNQALTRGGGGGQINVMNNISVDSSAGGDPSQGQRFARQIAREVDTAVVASLQRQRRPGGLLNPALGVR